MSKKCNNVRLQLQSFFSRLFKHLHGTWCTVESGKTLKIGEIFCTYCLKLKYTMSKTKLQVFDDGFFLHLGLPLPTLPIAHLLLGRLQIMPTLL